MIELCLGKRYDGLLQKWSDECWATENYCVDFVRKFRTINPLLSPMLFCFTKPEMACQRPGVSKMHGDLPHCTSTLNGIKHSVSFRSLQEAKMHRSEVREGGICEERPATVSMKKYCRRL